jgi:hypothetical protein
MANDLEKSVRKWMGEVSRELAATPFDLAKCANAYSTLTGHLESLLDETFRPINLPVGAWSDALLAQAREDLRAIEILSADGARPASVLAMLLQMVFEKLAKAALARTDEQAFIACRTSHVAASRLVNQIKNHNKFLQLRYSWKDVLPLVQALEKAHPAVSKSGPHLEYPWEDGSTMRLPATIPIVMQLADPFDMKGPRLIRFAQELANKFDSIFQPGE